MPGTGAIPGAPRESKAGCLASSPRSTATLRRAGQRCCCTTKIEHLSVMAEETKAPYKIQTKIPCECWSNKRERDTRCSKHWWVVREIHMQEGDTTLQNWTCTGEWLCRDFSCCCV